MPARVNLPRRLLHRPPQGLVSPARQLLVNPDSHQLRGRSLRLRVSPSQRRASQRRRKPRHEIRLAACNSGNIEISDQNKIPTPWGSGSFAPPMLWPLLSNRITIRISIHFIPESSQQN
jgi:hypothetical protein